MPSSLGARKPAVKHYLHPPVYDSLNMDEHRRKRLAELIASRYKGDRGELIRESGYTKGRVAQFLSQGEPFGERSARELERRIGLPERWLDREEIQNTEPASSLKDGVPLISWIRAGSWGEAADPFQPGEAEAWVPSMRPTSAKAFALRVRGDSMTAPYGKSYPAGSIIIVEPERRSPSNGERIVAKLVGSDEVTFKVYKEEDGRRWLQPLNPQHESIREPFKVLGTVVGKWEED
jgi:SOS-response transcriptional repressor LexA